MRTSSSSSCHVTIKLALVNWFMKDAFRISKIRTNFTVVSGNSLSASAASRAASSASFSAFRAASFSAFRAASSFY